LSFIETGYVSQVSELLLVPFALIFVKGLEENVLSVLVFATFALAEDLLVSFDLLFDLSFDILRVNFYFGDL